MIALVFLENILCGLTSQIMGHSIYFYADLTKFIPKYIAANKVGL